MHDVSPILSQARFVVGNTYILSQDILWMRDVLFVNPLEKLTSFV